MRHFNTSGPVVAQSHYCIPPLERMGLGYVLNLIHAQKYLTLHAPRLTGKTSALKALQNRLNSGVDGNYRCLYANIEAAEVAREDIERAISAILHVLAGRTWNVLGDSTLAEIRREALAKGSPDTALWDAL